MVDVNATGLVTPLKDGAAKVRVSGPSGMAAECKIQVEGFAHPIPINFTNQIVPIFTKLGCNSGGCHGKASGQNGFKLVAAGFLSRGRLRVSGQRRPAAGACFHRPRPRACCCSSRSAARRTAAASGWKSAATNTGMLYRWIEQGMPYGSEKDPTVVAHQVLPRRPRHGPRQRAADHRRRPLQRRLDRRRDADGPVRAERHRNGRSHEHGAWSRRSTLSGEVAVMARYQGQVATFRATIPLGAEVEPAAAPKRIFIDRAVFGQAQGAGHSAVAGLRRRDVHPPGLDRHRRDHADRTAKSATSWPTPIRRSATS